jgi:capsular polysaccharide biosynthesis protein
MPISQTHELLVKEIETWILENYNSSIIRIQVDDSFSNSSSRPPNIGGHIPDIYADSINKTKLLIGEAKTPGDLDNQRTVDQLTSYIKFLNKNGGGIVIIATQWSHANRAKSIAKKIVKYHQIQNVTIVVLDQLSV